jgi:DNA topoisomerase-1
MAENLVIVESPAKAKTIEKFLGKDYLVKSSYGHVRDLVKADKGINIANNFEPVYEISADKVKVVDELKKLSKKAKTVWLATDEDREGEAISWHLFESLALEKKQTKRIVFHEITKPAILEAIANPRFIDMNLVDAQQARRILDRLVGFELSPVLWKKVKPSLSAGRVQSVAVRLIVEREREIETFTIVSSFKVTAEFLVEGKTILKADLPQRFSTAPQAESFLQKITGAEFKIADLEKKPGKKTPSAPFTTSTLQQEASRKLGFSVAQTMMIAQRLYEAGKITYMRTDSVNLSNLAINAAKSAITKEFGKEYSHTRQYKTKSANAQEAHEAIRPTYFDQSSVDGERNEQRLYDLIWKRTIASQMADAELERTIVTISNNKTADLFTATGEVIKFDGFLRVYMESTDDEKEEPSEGLLPPLKKGQSLNVNVITATERFSSPPARYTEASLVKKLEELGIGRPSTYAPTISTIQKRGYVIKEDRAGKERNFVVFTLKNNKITQEGKQETFGSEKSKMFPTDIGTVVTDFLKENFKEIMDYNFTATVEKEFDEIAEGNLKWAKMIKDFYGPFHITVTNTEKNSERASGERVLGIHPVSKKQVSARIGRFGPLVQISSDKEDEKPQYAKLRSDQRLETITLEEALDLFKMPRTIGQFEDEDVVVAIGRFGPYTRHKSAFYSLAKTDDPYTIDLNRAIEIIKDKRQADKDRIIKTFKNNDEVQVLKGRWGPYLVVSNKNYRLPKGVDAEKLTLEECLNIAKTETPSAGRGRFKSKKGAEEKTVKVAAAKKAAPKKAAAKKTASKSKKK